MTEILTRLQKKFVIHHHLNDNTFTELEIDTIMMFKKRKINSHNKIKNI